MKAKVGLFAASSDVMGDVNESREPRGRGEEQDAASEVNEKPKR